MNKLNATKVLNKITLDQYYGLVELKEGVRSIENLNDNTAKITLEGGESFNITITLN